MTAGLLLMTFFLPLLLALAAIDRRTRALPGAALWIAPLPGLLAALLLPAPAALVLDARLSIQFVIDAPGRLLLGSAALLWSAAAIYARSYMRGSPHALRFQLAWLMTMSGSLGVFIAGDVVTFYLAFALASLPAYFLMVHQGSPAAQRAASIYLALAILGEALLLLAFVMLALAVPTESLSIADCVRALPDYPNRDIAILLLVAGFGLKAGLVPLHVWLPLAHPAAPMPASAVLSGAIIKAGIIGLIRFLPMQAAFPEWGAVIAWAGVLTAFYGAVVGITQTNPKSVLAYSSVSQMGLVIATIGAGLQQGAALAGLSAAFGALHHVLAKGAAFLGVGVARASGGARAMAVLACCVVLALSFGGVPFTGGALTKLAAKPFLGEGALALAASLAGAAC